MSEPAQTPALGSPAVGSAPTPMTAQTPTSAASPAPPHGPDASQLSYTTVSFNPPAVGLPGRSPGVRGRPRKRPDQRMAAQPMPIPVLPATTSTDGSRRKRQAEQMHPQMQQQQHPQQDAQQNLQHHQHSHQPPPPAEPEPPFKRARYQAPIDFSQLPDLPPYMTMKPDICKPTYTNVTSGGPSEFSYDMRVLVLTSTNQIDVWTDQVEAMARACGCHRELTTRFGFFPTNGTVEAFICQSRFMSCWRILTETISPPVWAYMRALGYNKIPVFKGADGVQWQPAPVDAYYYALQAAQRITIPGTAQQSRSEVMAMVEEVRLAKVEDYRSDKDFKKGHAWLKTILDNLIKMGDRQVCESMYDGNPDWAPNWPDEPPEELPWVLRGEPLSSKSKKKWPNWRHRHKARENEIQARKEAEAHARAELAAVTAKYQQPGQAQQYQYHPDAPPHLFQQSPIMRSDPSMSAHPGTQPPDEDYRAQELEDGDGESDS
ncbi:hypothetical protein B0H63DRAFT_245755 [Podospora didyma]|uniref:Uncharacterized protein n=1 Tax=Podospora didyma TaxID=330526 RepID=A0AAE0KKI6_9PEZI|nr:hypothetical protein B0H63DRAFT_245755 [Podospora didyma]